MTTPLMKTVAKAVRQGLVGAKATESVTLTRMTPGSRTVGNYAGGTSPTPTLYPCQGFVSNEKHTKIGETLVDDTHLVICVVGDTLAVTPQTNDRITIGGTPYPVIDLEGTPALWTLLCQK